MALSSVAVVTNSLRLRSFDARPLVGPTDDARIPRRTASSAARGRVQTDGAPDPRDLAGDFRHRRSVEVRFADTDAMGHVNNAVYLTYCRGRPRRATGPTSPASRSIATATATESLILAEARHHVPGAGLLRRDRHRSRRGRRGSAGRASRWSIA